MKTVLILTIKLYWLMIPKNKRRRCLFRTSCSNYVYQITENEGFLKGLAALKYRYLNCRSGFYIFENPIEGSKTMILPNGQLLVEAEIAERFISHTKSSLNGNKLNDHI